MRMASIASGSSGNCIYIGDRDTHVLIDAGVSCRRITTALGDLGIKPEELSALCVTHEHSDHIGGLPVLSKKLRCPLFSAKETLSWLRGHDPNAYEEKEMRAVREGEPFTVGTVTITPIGISHDAVHPLAYRVDGETGSAAVITDLGYYDDRTVAALAGLNAILLESNHDIRMLQAGPYPYPLKRRIMGDRGHLSNDDAGRLLNDILHDNMKHILLGHLSKENNYPELAYETVRVEIGMGSCPYKGSDFPIEVAARDVPSALIEF